MKRPSGLLLEPFFPHLLDFITPHPSPLPQGAREFAGPRGFKFCPFISSRTRRLKQSTTFYWVVKRICQDVAIRRRVAIDRFFSGKSSIVGLGVRPVRAGSIGREPLGSCKNAGLPPEKAGSFYPAPSTENPAPHSSKRIGLAPRPWERPAFTFDFSSKLGHPPVTEWLFQDYFRHGLSSLDGRLPF